MKLPEGTIDEISPIEGVYVRTSDWQEYVWFNNAWYKKQ